MATCKECLHDEVCAYKVKGLHICEKFKDKTKYVEQKYGRWILDTTYTGKNRDIYICSECNHYYGLRKDKIRDTIEIMKHKICCPNCGAKMVV